MSFFGFGKKENPVTPAVIQQATLPAGTEAAKAVAIEDKSPLEQHKDLWQTPAIDKDAKPPEDLFAIDQTKLGEAAGKLDFAKVVKREQLDAISRGGEEAVTAFASALNAVAQQTWQSNVATTSAFMKEAFAKKEAELDARISSALRNQGIDSALASNPVFNHPAAKPVVGAIARAMSNKYPDASPQELQAMAAGLLAEIAGGGQDTKGAPAKEIKAAVTDWDEWIVK